MGACSTKIQPEHCNMSEANNNLYYIQILEVTYEKFTIRLDTRNNININKKRKYYIKEIINTNQYNKLGQITIPKNKSFVTQDIYFQNDHKNNYKIAIYDQKNPPKPLSNIITLTKYPLQWNITDKYQPNPVSTSTMTTIENSNNKTLDLYWDTPALSFGKIKYKIIYSPKNYRKKNENIVDILPLSIPFELLPVQINIITISNNTNVSLPKDVIIGSNGKIKIFESENEKRIYLNKMNELHDFKSNALNVGLGFY
eukprot:302479_1